MKTLDLGNITIQVDESRTMKFYETQNEFTCDCKDCLNYVSKISDVQNSLNGIDEKLGIDLTKDVGQGMDELMPHDYDDHHLYVIPYYAVGKVTMNGKELEKQSSGPIWPNTKRAEHKMSDDLSLILINTSGDIEIEGSENVLSIWLEYKTELIEE